MAMGRRKPERQEALFVTEENVPRSQGHPFYKALTGSSPKPASIAGLRTAVSPSTTRTSPRTTLHPPGVYFRMLLVGYFEGILTSYVKLTPLKNELVWSANGRSMIHRGYWKSRKSLAN